MLGENWYKFAKDKEDLFELHALEALYRKSYHDNYFKTNYSKV